MLTPISLIGLRVLVDRVGTVEAQDGTRYAIGYDDGTGAVLDRDAFQVLDIAEYRRRIATANGATADDGTGY